MLVIQVFSQEYLPYIMDLQSETDSNYTLFITSQKHLHESLSRKTRPISELSKKTNLKQLKKKAPKHQFHVKSKMQYAANQLYMPRKLDHYDT